MKIFIVYRVLSLISLIVSMSMFLPLGFALNDGSSDSGAFAGSIALGGAVSLCLFFLSLGESDYKDLGIKEAFGVVGFSWVIASAVGALPYILSGVLPDYTDAFFEAMSGFSTTGASVIADIEACPRGILFWRGLTLWLGGMGIIVLGLAILPFFGVGGMELYKAEVPGPTPEKLTPRVHETALLLWGVYVSMTVIETVLLCFGGMTFFDALTHSLGTIASGGFSTKNLSVEWYHSAYVDWVITVFMFLSGVNFALHYKIISGDLGGYWRDEEFRFYAAVILICSAAAAAALRYENACASVADALRFGTFQVVSMITTTGYATADYETWPQSIQFMLLLLMFLGGCAGSTSGGIKNMRILILCRSVKAELKTVLHPNAIAHVRVNDKVVPRNAVSSVMTFTLIFLFFFVAGTMAVTSLGVDIITALSCVTATLCNIGQGFGLVGQGENYSWMPDSAKWILSFCMLAGRLELYAVLMLFLPATWRK